MADLPAKNNLLGIVGPCSAGKSTLISRLHKHGYVCRHIAQEHSYVPDMWKRLVNPRLLIYLDVSYKTSIARRPLNLSIKEFEEQERRLAHARQHAHILVDTDPLSPEEVFQVVMKEIEKQAGNP